ncbi:hypothetical protein LPJ66_010785, partial [Kickxella alabastrina]
SGSRTSKVTAKVDVALPCGYFNIWRPLHDSSTQPADRLAHYLPFKFTSGDATADSSQQGICKWDSRISYSSADDEYYQNGLVLPFIKTWYNGTLYTKNVFCKTEHDWGMVYLASNHENPNLQSMLAWRFNYAESKSIIDRFHAVLNFSLFAETAAIQWYIRPLTHKEFSLIPIHVLTAEEALAFPEVPKPPGAKEITSPIDARARIVQQYRGHLLAYREPPNELHTYAVHSVPGFAADLSQYVENEYGFEIWVQLCPATEGTNRWQKVQIARQPLLLGVGGRTRDNDDALARCGLDFRIKLRADIEVPPVSDSLSTALLPLDQGGAQVKPQMDDPRTADFTISVNDPENKVGCLQPPIRAHERVLAAGSEYFAALLASSMTESASKQVMLDNMAYGAVRVAINFLYTGEVSDAVLRNLDDWISLLGVAARLSIPRLHQICQLRILQAAITSVQENSLALSRAALKNNSSRGSSSTVSNGNLDDHSRYSCGPADFVSRCQIPCEFPDEEFFNYLVDIADDNGAQELTDALDRIKHYYPVVIQEHSIRTGPTKPFCALALDTTPPHLDNNHHPHLHNEFPVGFGPDDDDDGHSDDNDNDNDNDNEFGRGHFGRGGDAIGMQHMFMPGPLIQHEHIANMSQAGWPPMKVYLCLADSLAGFLAMGGESPILTTITTTTLPMPFNTRIRLSRSLDLSRKCHALMKRQQLRPLAPQVLHRHQRPVLLPHPRPQQDHRLPGHRMCPNHSHNS